MRFEHEGHKYEEVRTIPRGYDIWNIGNHAPPGYIPLCRLKAIQPCRTLDEGHAGNMAEIYQAIRKQPERLHAGENQENAPRIALSGKTEI